MNILMLELRDNFMLQWVEFYIWIVFHYRCTFVCITRVNDVYSVGLAENSYVC